MKDRTPLWMRWCALGAAGGLRAWMNTLDYQGLFYDPTADPLYAATKTRIYVFWHEYILVPLYMRGHCDLTMLLSRHRDADILYRLAYHMGFECVRGSTYGGATAALLELAREGKKKHLTITPDGPRGPRRVLAQGPIYLASRLGLPIVPMGIGIDRPWRLRSWDRFAIPRPGSRARAITGGEIQIPPNLDREGLELYRQHVERLLNNLGDAAEQWAVSGTPRVGAVPARRRMMFDRKTASWDCGPRGVPLIAASIEKTGGDSAPGDAHIRVAA